MSATTRYAFKNIAVAIPSVTGRVRQQSPLYLARTFIQIWRNCNANPGAKYSYREAQNNLEKINCKSRGINNHTQVKRLTGKVGEVLATQNLQLPAPEECAAPATELIVQVDGGHIPTQSQQKRRFEALAAIVYKPEKSREIDKNHRLIIDNNCVVSAQSDELKTIKGYLINAAKRNPTLTP